MSSSLNVSVLALEMIHNRGGQQPRSSQKVVANLWTEFAAQYGEALTANGKEPQNPNKLVVAATCEVAKT
jgi:hypothetical protein